MFRLLSLPLTTVSLKAAIFTSKVIKNDWSRC